MSKMRGAAEMPGHDMQSMKPDAAGQPAMPGHSTGPTKNTASMGGHDMGKMVAAPVPAGGKAAAPDKARSQQKAMPAHDMGKMMEGPGAALDMPGHDIKGLQADYGELGISEAQLVQAGRLSNPLFSFGRLSRGGKVEIERQLILPVMSLLTMPVAKRIARPAFEQAQLRAAGDALSVADNTRRAYFSAVAAQETVTYISGHSGH